MEVKREKWKDHAAADLVDQRAAKEDPKLARKIGNEILDALEHGLANIP